MFDVTSVPEPRTSLAILVFLGTLILYFWFATQWHSPLDRFEQRSCQAGTEITKH
jgi:hypothetical protein